jgi:UTP:GlnB (protein PII) uridylyltransferase
MVMTAVWTAGAEVGSSSLTLSQGGMVSLRRRHPVSTSPIRRTRFLLGSTATSTAGRRHAGRHWRTASEKLSQKPAKRRRRGSRYDDRRRGRIGIFERNPAFPLQASFCDSF